MKGKVSSRCMAIVLLVAVFWMVSGSALAVPSTQTIVLRQGLNGYSGSRDTYLTKYPAGADHSNEQRLAAGYKQQYVADIQWDLSQIPVGSTIVSAKLRLYAVGWTPGNTGFQAFAVLGNPYFPGINWNRARIGEPWKVPGCNGIGTDRRGTPAGSFAAAGINKWYEMDLTSLVQEWVNGTLVMNGVVIRGISAYDLAIYYFASAQHPNASQRPQLVVKYYSPPI